MIDTLRRGGNGNEYDPDGDIVGQSDPSARFPAIAYDPYDFFQKGMTYNNNIALSGGTPKSGYRISLGNLHQTGIIPLSKYDKTTFSVNGQTVINDKFTVSAAVNYVHSVADKVQQGSNISSIMPGLLRTQPA